MEMSDYGYKCAGGETWDGIALELWGDEKYASDLICANPQYSQKIVFTGGELLYLPVVRVPENDGVSTPPATAPWKE